MTVSIIPILIGETSDIALVELSVVLEASDFIPTYDRLEIWRSRSLVEGPYEELTTNGWRPARVPHDAADPPASPVTGPQVNIVGSTLELLVDRKTTVTVTFTGTDPLTYSAVASQITTQGLELITAYVATGGKLVVQTKKAGLSSLLEVTGGTAAPLLGLSTTAPTNLGFGLDPRIHLVEGQNAYTLVDYFSSRSYFYRTRFRNQLLGTTSAFEAPVSAEKPVGLPSASLVVGQAYVIDMEGRPLEGVEVQVHTPFNGFSSSGKTVADRQLLKSTDRNGLVQFTLVRGQRVTVSMMGTDLVKQIDVPTDLTMKIFDLFSGGPELDYFKVIKQEIPFATKRSL